MKTLRSALSAVTVSAAFVAAPAAHADAPYRFTGIDPMGNQSTSAAAGAVGPGGKEVLFNGWARRDVYSPQPLLRDVVAAKTTSLGATNSSVIGASDDLAKVLVSTDQKLDPADTNSYPDEYLIDRTAGTTTLLSRDWPNGSAYGPFGSWVVLSGDGKTAYLSATRQDGNPEPLRKIDLATKTITFFSSGRLRTQHIDTAGKVVMTETALVAGSRSIAIPADAGSNFVSPDGSAAAVKNSAGLTIVNVTAGTTRTAVVPAFLATGGYDLLGIANGGATAYVGATVTTAGVKKYAVATMSTSTGALTIVRNDIPWVAQSGSGVLSSDLAFVAFGTHVAQLGSIPLSGPSVGIPDVPAGEFLRYLPGCSYGGPLTPAIRPSLILRGTSLGINGRRPTKAEITVTVDKTGGVANRFTFTAGQRRDLTAGWGGFTINAKITYSDGSTSSGIKKIAPYTPIVHDSYPFSPGSSQCESANTVA